MGSRDPRGDAYIERSAEFARPVLSRLREIVHAACPEVQETIKWGAPHFEYRGLLCHMAAFKRHCAFGFWKGALIVERDGPRAEKAMGQFGRIASLDDLPPEAELAGYVHEAMRLNEAGVKSPTRSDSRPKPEAAVPEDLAAALRENPAAGAAFEAFPPGHRREYVEWITGAKTDATRQRRIATAVEWIAEGRSRNWKYERK
jgi:uncharacterized protein YdeI (YjbR/CyaY-like superfamily)